VTRARPKAQPVTTLVLVRHGRTAANADGTLAGWTPGVDLDDAGRAQSEQLADRLRPVALAAVVSSPLERCLQTAQALAAGRDGLQVQVDPDLGECHYGDWTGRKLADLVKDPLWRVVQAHPSAARFPGADGEALRDMQARAVDSVRTWNARLPSGSTWLAVSHADVIKAVVADALGLHLDQFQRIQVDPCSVSVVRYTELRPFVVRLNDTGRSLDGLVPPPRRRARRERATAEHALPVGDAAVGGGAGGTP
jgi:probable phosphomutase (TIGR03848 family)